MKYIRKYPLSCLTAVAIWVVCLIPRVEVPEVVENLSDKWAHALMYLIFVGIVWTEYAVKHRNYSWKRLVLFGFVAPILMGGLIEIAQATCTGGSRNGDWLDFVANGIGVAIACALGSLWLLTTRNRDAAAKKR